MLDIRTRPRSASPLASADLPAEDRFTGPPIFVSGCNRGGTTVLTRLLAAHPEVRDIGRGQFDEGQFIWRRRLPDWSRHRWAVPPWRWLTRRTAEHVTPALAEFFRREFARAMPAPGRLLEKTPANAVRIPFIDRLYPDCFFVHIVRDGRHTSASLMARKVHWLYAPHQWVGAHRTALADLARLPTNRVIHIRYEELVAAPERVLGDLFRQTGAAWARTEREAVMSHAAETLRPVDCRWSRLPDRPRHYVLSVIRDLQETLGYPTVDA